VIDDAAFDKTVKDFMAEVCRPNQPRLPILKRLQRKNHGDKLTAFFAQWVDGTGAPEFKMKYTVYRVKKGFRVVGEITQDLDLFRMPLELESGY